MDGCESAQPETAPVRKPAAISGNPTEIAAGNSVNAANSR